MVVRSFLAHEYHICLMSMRVKQRCDKGASWSWRVMGCHVIFVDVDVDVDVEEKGGFSGTIETPVYGSNDKAARGN